jgi:hypothetical protein
MIKPSVVAFFLATFAAPISAQQADPCSGLTGSALGQCRGDRQKLLRIPAIVNSNSTRW